MQRVSPTVIAAIALGALILLIIVMMVFGSRSSEDDRLTGPGTVASAGDPADRCSGQATYDEIKKELFRRAAAARGGDEAAFNKIATYASVRMEAVVLRDDSAEGITCNGTLTLDLPAGVAIAGGRRSLSADVLYTVQTGASASGSGVALSNADDLISQLASLAKTETPAEDALSNTVTNDVAEVPSAPSDPLAPIPGGNSTNSAANPNFNCANARTSGEVAVCNDPGLAALDRRMSAQYASAIAQADPEQRALLQRTGDAFIGYRDQCTSNSCIADTYRGRMREIRDIMMGSWTPQH
ncbi:MAG TPA: hypothetical protein VFH89_05070 [Sphingomicrobium sp.]|nr:hypothetical protein [Sphingomicrobium sp.]